MSEFENVLLKAEEELSAIVGTKVSISVSLSPRTASKMIYAFTGESDKMNLEKLIELIAEVYGITTELIKSRSKERKAGEARAILYYLAHARLDMHVDDIAHEMDRNRSTVVKVIDYVNVQRKHHDHFAENMATIEFKLLKILE